MQSLLNLMEKLDENIQKVISDKRIQSEYQLWCMQHQFQKFGARKLNKQELKNHLEEIASPPLQVLVEILHKIMIRSNGKTFSKEEVEEIIQNIFK